MTRTPTRSAPPHRRSRKKSAPALRFDARFGEAFFEALPVGFGIYRFFNSEDEIIYVGKAKNLKRRLSQYRNAKRRKKSLKMRAIVAEAARLEIETCPSEKEALLLENQWIQKHRPKLNIAGAFSFLYPFIGFRQEGNSFTWITTTEPEAFEGRGFEWHGAFRSRHWVKEAFYALKDLLAFVGHPQKVHREPRIKYARLGTLRGIPEEWQPGWSAFFRGESPEILETLFLELLENAGARKRARWIQERIRTLKSFWLEEAQPLYQARIQTQTLQYPIPQNERDPLFLRFKNDGRIPR